MKKVVSALTAAALCASMAATAASVFAAYTASDMAYSLRVVDTGAAGDYTVSADGSTITFASAEAAANATFVVGQYLECDPTQVAMQQVGGCVTVSDNAVGISASDYIDLGTAYYDAAKEYTLSDGSTISTNLFVNCFGYLNKLKKYTSGAAIQSWGDSSTWPDAWGYADKNRHLIWSWAGDLKNPNATTDTALFIDSESDAFPLMAFNVTLGSDIADGTYTIEWVETYTNDWGLADATYFNDGSGSVIPATLKDLTIVVGEETTTTESTPAPTETTTTTESTPAPTETTATDDGGDTDADGHTWDIGDAVAEDGIAYVDIFVTNDPGTSAYRFNVLIEVDGKWMTLPEAGAVIGAVEAGAAYKKMTMFSYNEENGLVTAANGVDTVPEVAVEGEPVVTYGLLVDGMADGVYNLKFDDTLIAQDNTTEIFPNFTMGTLTIGDVVPTETTTTSESEATTTTTTTTTIASSESTSTTTETTPAPTTGDYLYGDVNKNGKVELVDIVMLNRYLTGYDNQQLDDYQMEVADCWDDGKVTGTDSLTILKYLIGLRTALPVATN